MIIFVMIQFEMTLLSGVHHTRLPVAERACEHEVVWLDGNVFRAGPKGVDDAVAAIRKIHSNARN